MASGLQPAALDTKASQSFAIRSKSSGKLDQYGVEEHFDIIPTENDKSKKKDVEKEKAQEPVCSYTSLYRTADQVDWACMAVGTFGAIVNGVAWPMFAIIFGQFTDVFGQGASSPNFEDKVSEIALYFLYLGIGSAAGAFLQSCLWIYSGNRQANRLRMRYLHAVLHQDIAYFDTSASTGALLAGLNDDTQQVQAAVSEKVAHFIQHTVTFLAGWIVAFVRGWDMALVMVGCLPFLATVGGVLSKLTVSMQAKAQDSYNRASNIANQAISQVRTVAAYGQEETHIKEYDDQLESPMQVGIRQSLITGISLGGINTIVYCTYAVAFAYGVWRVSTGHYSGGQVLQVLVAALLGGFSLGQATPVLETFYKGRAAGARLFDVVERKPSIVVEAPGLEPAEAALRGEIVLRDVHFAYPARPEVRVFNGFSLTIPAGKTVALVGESGSGKSTVVQLLERFYDPLEGEVLLDGVDVRQYNLRWLRQNVGLVSQEPTLFATTIWENIAMGKEGAGAEEVEAAARAANAHSFISSLPLAYQTQVGERGLQLSGGQKQRIAIARAILKNPKVLLLDEATSALDTHSERLVQAALDRMVVGRTTVVVAHRLSTIQNADIIAVVKQGQVAEQGDHATLIKDTAGMYYTLVKLQMAEAEAREEVVGVVDSDEEVVEVAKQAAQQAEHAAITLPNATQPVRASKEWNPVKRVSASGATGKRGSLEVSKDRRTSGAGGPATLVDMPPETSKDALEPASMGAAAKEPKPPSVPMSRLLSYNRPEWAYAAVGIVASSANGCVNPAFAFIISSVINVFYTVVPSEMLAKAGFWSGMFVVIGAGCLIVSALQQYCFGVMGQKLARRVRVALFRSILYQEIGWFDMETNTSGVLTSRLAAEATHVRGAVGDSLALVLQCTACLAFGYIVAFIYMWRMALLITGALPFMLAGAIIYYKTITGFESGSGTLYAKANQAVSDAFSSIRVVQAYNLQSYVCRLYQKLLGSADETMGKRSLVVGGLMSYSQFSTFAVYGLIIWFGGLEVYAGRSNFDDMLKAFLAILISALGIAQAQIGFPDAGKAKAAVQVIFPIIDRKPLINAADESGERPEAMRGEIELQAVTFAYPSRPSVIVFRNFSLTIAAGNTVALVGESGSGKSTVVGLLERFYEPLEGRVLLDGRELSTYNLRWLRKHIGLVSQEPLLLSCSVLDNIRYGRPDASMEQVIEAAKTANIHALIEKMPERYNTFVGDRGIQLSGGQKQRIAIARAVLKDPRVLLLDEATSALDSASERLVQDALDRIMVGRTAVVVAHRLSTIRNAHTIALVYRGQVLEKGTHEELMALPDGGYAKLVAAQGGAGTKAQTPKAAAASLKATA